MRRSAEGVFLAYRFPEVFKGDVLLLSLHVGMALNGQHAPSQDSNLVFAEEGKLGQRSWCHR